MKPFLKQVADYYFSDQYLHLRQFIFPSQRAKTFFLHYLRELAEQTGRIMFAPQCTTVNEYILSLAPELQAIDKTELLFDLYDCRVAQRGYIGGEGEEGLDDFLFWGNIILSDFDLIDRHLVDARQLYRNIEGLKELEDNELDFLGEETKASIEQYFKGFINTSRLSDQDKENHRSRFLAFWQSLYELYSLFGEHINKTQRAYEGYIYRRVANDLELAERLETQHTEALSQGIRPLVFVGLFELSKSERNILHSLYQHGLAEFFWDEEVHVIQDRKHPASRLMARNTKLLPSVRLLEYSPKTWQEGEIAEYLPKEVRVYHAASTVTEVKALPKILEDCNIPLTNKPDELNTAIILTDEQMLLPVVSSIPTDYEYLNISLGYPLSRTSVSTLINRWMRLILGGYKGSYPVPGLIGLLSLQLLTEYFPKLHNLTHAMRKQKNYMLRGAWIIETFYPHINKETEDEDKLLVLLKILLTPEQEALPFLHQLDTLLDLLAEPMLKQDLHNKNNSQDTESIAPILDDTTEESIEDSQHERILIGFELNFLMHYKRLLRRLIGLLEDRQYGTLSLDRAVHLLEGLVRGLTIPFKGDPLQGLQIMGLLESRSLHFDNLIYLAAEDGKLPKRKHNSTFIPNILRYAYGLPTREYEEAAESYRFYQSIAHCKCLALLVSEDDILGKGEESRYISQLGMLYQVSIKHKSIELPPKAEANKSIVIHKDQPEILNKLQSWFLGENNQHGNQARLSASALNTYLQCPLRFYYLYIKGITEDQEPSELISANDYGTILHDTLAKRIYNVPQGTIIDAVYLDHILGQGLQYISSKVAETYIEHYRQNNNKRELNKLDLYSIELLSTMLLSILKYDRSNCPFVYLYSEVGLLHEIAIQYEGQERLVAFKGFIDRIDQCQQEGEEFLRILDYKTGSDKIETFANCADLFLNPKKYKAMIQTLLYSEMLLNGRSAKTGEAALNSSHLNSLPLRPALLIVPQLIGQEENYSPYLITKPDKKVILLDDYRKIRDDYMGELRKHLEELFDRTIPFTQAADKAPCQYCQFNSICRHPVNK